MAACGDGGFLPAGRLQSETTELRRYDSCAKLERDLEDSLIAEAFAHIEQRDLYTSRGDGGAEDASSGAGTAGAPRQEGVDYSGTNNQEAGVDEADFVKTDGYHLYAVNGNQLHIFAVPQFGALNPVSATNLEGRPTEMLLDKDNNRVVVFSSVRSNTLPTNHPLYTALRRGPYGYEYWRVPEITKVTVLDITNRAAPVPSREFYFEGRYQTARRIDSTVRVASYAWIEAPELWNWYDDYERYGEARTMELVQNRIRARSLADLIPQLYAREAGGRLQTRTFSDGSCRSFLRATDSHAKGIASILSFDLEAQQLTWDADHVVSNYATFYASKDTLVLAATAHDWWWYWWYSDDADDLNVHAFDISKPGGTSYIGSGRVRGTLGDQFAIDEEQGAIRLATTSDPWWRWWRDRDRRTPPENHVWVLEHQAGTSQLNVVGHLGGIAVGERITAARFLGDKGYLVTFRRTDPLFTLDLSDRTNPRVVGELVVPGFSTYLHPLDGDKLLSIGVGGDQNGANWKTTVSLFDVSNFAAPRAASVLPIAADSGWSWSEALWEHKAFTYWAPKQLLAVPQSTFRQVVTGAGNIDYAYVSKLQLVHVDPASGLAPAGEIDHSAYYNADRRYFWGNVDIRRSIFMGEFVYAISDKAITVHRLSDLGKVADAPLPGFRDGTWWWGWAE